MDLNNLQLIAAMKRRMGYIGERQSVLAKNIANANTPHYKSVDLQTVDFNKQVQRHTGNLPLAVTHPGHIAPRRLRGSTHYATVTKKDDFLTTPNGNNVSLEEELMKMDKNAADYRATTSLYQKMTTLFTTAIDGGTN